VPSLKTEAKWIKQAKPKTAGKLIKQAKKGSLSPSNSPELSISYAKKPWLRRVLDLIVAGKPSVFTIPCKEVPFSMNTSNGGTYSFEPQLARILSLERGRDWDGEGAQAITMVACQAAVFFGQLINARSFRAPDWIAPSTEGAVGFTWRTKTDQLNIQVLSLQVTGFVVRRAGPAGRYQRQCSVEAALDEVGSFLALDRGK